MLHIKRTEDLEMLRERGRLAQILGTHGSIEFPLTAKHIPGWLVGCWKIQQPRKANKSKQKQQQQKKTTKKKHKAPQKLTLTS